MHTHRHGQRGKHLKRASIWRELLTSVVTAMILLVIALLVALPTRASTPEYIPQGIEPEINQGAQPLDSSTIPEAPITAVPHDRLVSRLGYTEVGPVLFDLMNDDGVEIPEEDTTPDITYMATRAPIEVKEYDSTVDYSAVIRDLYESIDESGLPVEQVLILCEMYELQRNMKIEDTEMDLNLQTFIFSADNSIDYIEEVMHPHEPYMQYTETDVRELAALIYAEAGAEYTTYYHKQCVGSVVLCRLADPDRWGDYTIHDVIWHPGQYPTKHNTKYDDVCYEIAKDLLENGPVVYAIWQANFPQGENVEYFEYPGLCRPTWIDK